MRVPRQAVWLFLVFAFFVLSAQSDEDCAGTTEEPSVESGKKDDDSPPKTAGVGDKLTLKGTTYQVTDVRTAQTLGDNQFTRAKASGQFVVVKLSLTNRKNEPATILEDNIRLIGGNGKNYSSSDDAILALEDQSFLLEEIQPDNTERGSLVYDLPRRAVPARNSKCVTYSRTRRAKSTWACSFA